MMTGESEQDVLDVAFDVTVTQLAAKTGASDIDVRDVIALMQAALPNVERDHLREYVFARLESRQADDGAT
jgi:hypothetical protein